MAKPSAPIRLISPTLDKEIKNLMKIVKSSFGRTIGYKQACKVYAKIMREKGRLRFSSQKLNELLGAPEEY